MRSSVETTIEILLWIAVFVPLTLLWVAVMVDLVRRPDLSVPRKMLWGVLVLLSAHVGVVLYFVFRPVPRPPGKDLAISADRSSTIVLSLERLRDDYRAGNLSHDDYLATKREILGVS